MVSKFVEYKRIVRFVVVSNFAVFDDEKWGFKVVCGIHDYMRTKTIIGQHLIRFVTVATIIGAIVSQQSYAQANKPKVNVVNSIYCTIRETRMKP